MTVPTPAMLAAIGRATLGDDVEREDAATARLEAQTAALLGHEAGLLVLSGTMGNQLAARAHLAAGPPHSVLADARAHILRHEAGGLAATSGAWPLLVWPSEGREYLTLADVEQAAVLDEDVHEAPTRLIALENTLHGAVLPLAECARIGAWARHRGIKTHLDGARLWHAVTAQVAASEHGGGGLAAGMRAHGACVDSVTVCFSKGLGAPIGSLLVGSAAFVQRARHLRKMLGGGMRQTGILAAPALTAVRDTFFGGGLARAHAVAARIGREWTSRGGRLVRPVETSMVWLDLRGETAAQGRRMQRRLERECARTGIRAWPGAECRLACHYQISDEAVQRLCEDVLPGVLAAAEEDGADEDDGGGGATNGTAETNGEHQGYKY